ncbi:MAG: hypothetical protein H6622_13950 [Halobacteriovoraceae bacterium]|nr:hypothetical protein [Halobacteriovoraceae bacterium]
MRGKILISFLTIVNVSCTDQSEFFIKDKEVLFGKAPTVDELDDLEKDEQVKVIKDLCKGEVNSKVIEANFGANYSSCPWNTADNGDRINAKITARVERNVVFELPPNIAICDISFTSPQSSMNYDDDFLLLLDNAVVATNNWMVSEGYDEFGTKKMIFDKHPHFDYYIYDWSKLIYTPAKQPSVGNVIHEAGYCLGRNIGSNCRWPKTENDGVIQVSIASEKIKEIMLENLKNSAHSLSFVVTGDDDINTDCSSSQVKFNLDIKYINLSE